MARLLIPHGETLVLLRIGESAAERASWDPRVVQRAQEDRQALLQTSYAMRVVSETRWSCPALYGLKQFVGDSAVLGEVGLLRSVQAASARAVR